MSGLSSLYGIFWVPDKGVCISIPLQSHVYYEGSGTTFDQRRNLRYGDQITLLMNKDDGRVKCQVTYLCKGR